MARPDHFGRRLTMLAKPEFDVHDVYESGIIEKSDGHYQAHWHCRLTARNAVDEFAVLRFLKLLTGSGFRILRFDDAFSGIPPHLMAA
jgi:hypothetical protein